MIVASVAILSAFASVLALANVSPVETNPAESRLLNQAVLWIDAGKNLRSLGPFTGWKSPHSVTLDAVAVPGKSTLPGKSLRSQVAPGAKLAVVADAV